MMTIGVCIAHGGDISEPSGGTNRIIAFANALHEAGFDVLLVIPTPKRELPDSLKNDIHIHTVPIKARSVKDQMIRALLVSSKAKRLAEENNMVLQIEHSTLAGIAASIGCSKYVLDMHDLAFDSQLYSQSPFSKIIKRFIYFTEKMAVKYSSKIIVVSNPMKKYITENWNIPKEKIIVIPNGYFEEKIKKLNFDKNNEIDGLVSFLGTLHPKLDIDKIIYLAKSLKNIKIYIIGDGPVRLELERKIIKNNLKNIIITGRLPDEKAFNILSKSQVVIYPLKKSIHTAVLTSVKIFDYAILGKAMVIDDVSESEIWKKFKEKKAAMFSDPSNPNEFVEYVRNLLEDKKLRKKIGTNAKMLVKEFSWENISKKLVELYRREII